VRKTAYTATGPMLDLTIGESDSSATTSDKEVEEVKDPAARKKTKTEEVLTKGKKVKGGKKAVGGGDAVMERLVELMEQHWVDKKQVEDCRYKQAKCDEKKNRIADLEQKLALAERLIEDPDGEVREKAKQLCKRTLAKMMEDD
jgi:ribosomal protein L16/L10AE